MKLSHALATLLSTPFALAIHPVRPSANEGPFLRTANNVAAVSDASDKEEDPARPEKWVLLYSPESGHVLEEVDHLPPENTANEDSPAFVQAGNSNWSLDWELSNLSNADGHGDLEVYIGGNRVLYYCHGRRSNNDISGSYNGCHKYESDWASSVGRPSIELRARTKDAKHINYAVSHKYGDDSGSSWLEYGVQHSSMGWCISTDPNDIGLGNGIWYDFSYDHKCYRSLTFHKNGNVYGKSGPADTDYYY